MDELGEDARGLLEAFRADERPSRARREAIWDELGSTGASARPRRKVPPVSRASAASPARSPGRIWVTLVALAAAAVLVLAWARWSVPEGARSEPSIGQTPSEALHALNEPPRAGVAESVGSDAPAPHARSEVPESPEIRAEEPPVERPSKRSGPRSRDDESGELGLIEGAQHALREGRADRALELLDRHARSHPQGALAEERTFLRAQALCAAGRLDEARALATEFVATRPQSAYAGKMRRVCIQRPSRP